MVYKIRIACVPWMSRFDGAEEKCWVIFEWTEKPHMSWKPEDTKEIDHRLVVKFFSQEQGQAEGLLKQWNDIVCVKFVEDEGIYKMQLYDSQNHEIQHAYLRCESRRDNGKLEFSKKTLTQNSYEWNVCLHWDFKSNADGSYTASMQHLPHAKFNTSLRRYNNSYTVAPLRATGKPLRTGLDGPDMPKDLHPMIWGYVFEAERDERYRARELRFSFRGYIALADRVPLLQGVNEWCSIATLASPTRSSLEEQILQRLEPRLSAVFHALFRSTEDRVNLAGPAWTQTVFQITSLRPEINEHDYVQRHGVRLAQILAASADGLHRIRLQFTRLPVGGPYTSVCIQYVGPQRFNTFDDRNISQARGGTLEERRGGPPAAGRRTNDTAVFEGWHP